MASTKKTTTKKQPAKKAPGLPTNAFHGKLDTGDAPAVGAPTAGSVFVWHGKDSQESAEALAAELGGTAGTLPPKGFSGHLVCLSPGVSEKFKWEDRTFGTIVNDPRKGYKKTDDELAPLLGAQVRMYCVSNGTVTGSGATKGYRASVFLRSTPEQAPYSISGPLLTAVSTLSFDLGMPHLVAFDGLLKGHTFIPSKVIYAPSLTDAPAVRAAIKALVPTKKAKDLLKELVSSSSEEEASVLYRLLGRLKEDPKLVESVVGE